jgi:peptide/nickel transport system substrate-binding protein
LAAELLDRAGYKDGLKLSVHAPTSIPSEGPRLASAVAEDVRRIGIEAQIVLHDDRPEYARKVANKELEGLLCFDSSPLSSYKVLREKFDSRFAGPWWQGYESEAFNSLLSQVAAAADTARRESLYKQAYRLLHHDAPWLFLYAPERFWGVKEGSITIDDAGYLAI